ncbi:MAG: MFS transporter [Acidimicrobiia bacterium]|nr:MFS transporter [Acidimicrobiia bacterium]
MAHRYGVVMTNGDKGTTGRLSWPVTVILGLVPVAAFGTWFYGFGVLLTPIVSDTGWQEASLSSAYGASSLLGGILGVLAGRISEKWGTPIVFAFTGVVSIVGSWLVASTTSEFRFSVGVALVAGVVAAAGYYSLVHSSIARIIPDDRRRAITINTFFGAFASVIFLPAIAWLIGEMGWRDTMRVTGIVTGMVFILAAILITDRGNETDASTPRFGRILLDSFKEARLRRLLFAGVCGAFAMSVLVLYQVPAMVDDGLALATASAFAGARGFLQLGGRIPIPWLGRTIGDSQTMRLSLVGVALSLVMLPQAGTIGIAVMFIVVAGFAIGAYSTIENIVGSGLVDSLRVGTFLGMYALVRGIGFSVGPTISGVVTDITESRTPALLVAAGFAVVAVVLIPTDARETS